MTPEDIAAGARTVAHLATHFQELEDRVRERHERRSATDRGYFTPAEDEEGRHFLVSYWQARNALFELITSFRQDPDLPNGLRPAAFLVGYGAAVLLVDAARFLREAFDGNRVVRAKLNEPEPSFGIPAGVYDTVQASLTSPRHAWHLYHALEFLDRNADDLRNLATTGPMSALLAPVWQVVERRGDRIRVPAGRYARARVRVRLRQAATRVGRDGVGLALYGIVKLASSLAADRYLRPGHRPAIPAAICQSLAGVLRPGDVLVVRKEHALTNYFLPGYWPHAALYLGHGEALARLGIDRQENVQPRMHGLLACDTAEPRRVLEAMKDGVLVRSIESPLRSDSLVVLRPRLAPDDIAAALARGLFHEGKPYDFDFDFTRSDRLVCTEVVYRSYDGIGGISFQLKRRAGRMTLAAEDLLAMARAREGFEPICVFAPAFTPGLLTGAAMDEVLNTAAGGR
jgi:hypothetical protein